MVNSKKKGNRTELEMVKILREWWDDDSFQRNLESGATATLMEARGAPADVVARLSGDILTPYDFPYCIEHKAYKEIDLYACVRNPENSLITQWWNQCLNDAIRAEKIPMLVFKEDRKARYAVLPADYIREKDWTEGIGKGSIEVNIKLDEMTPVQVAKLRSTGQKLADLKYQLVSIVLLSEFIESFPKEKLLSSQ